MCSAEILIPLIFSMRNGFKCFTQGDKTRGAASLAQGAKVADAVAQTPSIFGTGVSGSANSALKFVDKGIENIAKAAGKADDLDNLVKASGTATTIGAIASKVVNPLLCVAAGARVIKDDDPYAALIEETAAMGAMFGTEKLMKTAKNIFYDSASGAIQSTELKNGVSKELATLGKKFGELSKGKQNAVKVGIGLAFVTGSILSYSAGKALASKISNREDSKTKTVN